MQSHTIFDQRDLITQILLKLDDPQDVISFLETNKQLSQLVEKNLFWESMCSKHFPNVSLPKPESDDFKFLFRKLYLSQVKQLGSEELSSILVEDKAYTAIITCQDHEIFNELENNPERFFWKLPKWINQMVKSKAPNFNIKLTVMKEAPVLFAASAPTTSIPLRTMILDLHFLPDFTQVNEDIISKISEKPLRTYHIASCRTGNSDPILNPIRLLMKGKIELEKVVKAKIERKNKESALVKARHSMTHLVKPRQQSNVELNQELQVLIENARTISELITSAHQICQKASAGTFVNDLTKALRSLVGKEYDRALSQAELIKQCESKNIPITQAVLNKYTL